MWAPDSRELYYVLSGPQDKMMAVTVEAEPSFAVGNPRLLFEAPYHVVPGRTYDISPDGKRFLMIKNSSQDREAGDIVETTARTELIVVENWLEEVKRLAPVEGK